MLYLGNTATVALKDGTVKLTEKTKYPWEGDVQITVEPEKKFVFRLNLRVPGWCRSAPKITVNGQILTDFKVDKGYAQIERTWKPGDVVRLSLPMPVERVYADRRSRRHRPRGDPARPHRLLPRGVDNHGGVRNLVLPKDAKLTATFDKDLLSGVVVVRGEARSAFLGDGGKLATKTVPFQAVPYCTWDNRRPGPMAVWLPESPELAASTK